MAVRNGKPSVNVVRERARWNAPGRVPFRLLKKHPLLCGINLFYYQVEWQQSCLERLVERGAILGTLHLYNAVQQAGFLDLPWPDMEYLLESHSSTKSFIGARPMTLTDFMRHWAMVNGVSPSFFSPQCQTILEKHPERYNDTQGNDKRW